MSFLPGMSGPMAMLVVPFALSFTDSVSPETIGANTYSFTDRAIGESSGGRLVVCAVHWALTGSTTLSSATIGGVAATIVAQCNGTNTGVAIIAAVVPTGTTATVALTWAASVARGGIGLWRMVGQVSNTAYDFDNPAGGAQAVRTVTLDVPAGGGVIVASEGDQSNATTWTNATERYDYVTANDNSSGADDVTATLLSGRVITDSGTRVVCAASWQ